MVPWRLHVDSRVVDSEAELRHPQTYTKPLILLEHLSTSPRRKVRRVLIHLGECRSVVLELIAQQLSSSRAAL